MTRTDVAHVEPDVSGVPKADIHMHSETLPRLERLYSQRAGRAPYDWQDWVRRTEALPAGMTRLSQLVQGPPFACDILDHGDPQFVDSVTQLLGEAAGGNAVLAEVRFGAVHALRPGFMSMFREAEERVRQRHPGFFAEALVTGVWPSLAGATEIFDACLNAREDGLAGVDFIPDPYDSEADWTQAYRWAAQAAEAGLGVTAHAGEFSQANVTAALSLPGLTRLGHGVHAAESQDLLERMAEANVTVECCLTSNRVLGAVTSLESHPIRLFAEAGVPVTINTDDPVRLCTGIAREYAIAADLGFVIADLHVFTRNAIAASFTSADRRADLLAALTPVACV